jgi:molybdate transport system substrate-binding protein
VVGLLPEAAQEVTEFSAAVVQGAAHAQAGQALIRFLSSPDAAPLIDATGLKAAHR